MNRSRAGKYVLLAAEIAFICVAFVFISWMQSLATGSVDIEFSLAELANWWNWMVIIAQAMLCVFIINAIIDYGYNEKKNRVSSKLCRTLKTNELRVDGIYARKLFDKLDEAVQKENEAARQSCYVRHLRKINARIEWADIAPIFETKDETTIKALVQKFCVDDRQIRRFVRSLNKAIEGKYRDYETITAGDLLNKGSQENGGREGLKDKRRQVKGFLLGRNIFRFILFSAALSIVITKMIIDFSLVGTIANVIYIASAVFKGVSAMTYYCNYTEALFDRRNGMLARELDLTDEWETPIVKDNEVDREGKKE